MILLLRALFGLLGAFWLVSGVLVASGVLDLGLEAGAGFLGALMLGNGAALSLAGWLALRGHRVVDFLAVVLVLANGVSSLTDEVGPLDLASIAVSAALLVLLVAGLRSRPAAAGERL